MPLLSATPYAETPPWICEITSPSTEDIDRGPKRRIYATYGVKHLWRLNPVQKYLEVYALAEAGWLHVETYRDGEVVSAPPFDAISFPSANLRPLPRAPA